MKIKSKDGRASIYHLAKSTKSYSTLANVPFAFSAFLTKNLGSLLQDI